MNRRNFLISSAAAAQAAAAQAQSRQSESRQVSTAMIGTGNRGTGVLRGILEQPEAKVIALCDIKPDRLDSAATVAATHNPKTFQDWRRVIDMKEVEAVFVTTPPHLHAQMAIAALKAGKHVYCEKPIGVNAAQVQALLDAARSTSLVFTVGQQLRSHERLIQAVDKIHSGVLGKILMVKAQRHATRDHPADASSADWYFDVTKSGGYLIEQSVHNLDLCNWVIGQRPLRAAGFGGIVLYENQPPGRNRNIYDSGTISFDYPNDVTLSFTQNVFHPRGMPGGGQYVHVFGSEAACDLMYATTVYPREGESAPTVLAPEDMKTNPHAHTANFYAAITKGAPNPAPIEIGVEAAITAIMAHEAISRQKVVEWGDFGITL